MINNLLLEQIIYAKPSIEVIKAVKGEFNEDEIEWVVDGTKLEWVGDNLLIKYHLCSKRNLKAHKISDLDKWIDIEEVNDFFVETKSEFAAWIESALI